MNLLNWFSDIILRFDIEGLLGRSVGLARRGPASSYNGSPARISR